jgi:hypothetical protein
MEAVNHLVADLSPQSSQNQEKALLDIISEVEAIHTASTNQIMIENQELDIKCEEVEIKFNEILRSDLNMSNENANLVLEIATIIVNCGHGSSSSFYGDKRKNLKPSIFLQKIAEIWYRISCQCDEEGGKYSHTINGETIRWESFDAWYERRNERGAWRSSYRLFQEKIKKLGLKQGISHLQKCKDDASKAVTVNMELSDDNAVSSSSDKEKGDENDDDIDTQGNLEEKSSSRSLRNKKLKKLLKKKVKEIKTKKNKKIQHMLYFINSDAKLIGKGGHSAQSVEDTISRYNLVEAHFQFHFEPYGEELNSENYKDKVEEAFFFVLDLYSKHPLCIAVRIFLKINLNFLCIIINMIHQ